MHWSEGVRQRRNRQEFCLQSKDSLHCRVDSMATNRVVSLGSAFIAGQNLTEGDSVAHSLNRMTDSDSDVSSQTQRRGHCEFAETGNWRF